tara:strand:- start:590 stop:985 length:396 start_codon:yes stop_codon:yes gene_type:complete
MINVGLIDFKIKSEDKLNPEIKTNWLEALRNGKIRQAHKQLCSLADYDENTGTGLKMCCLGVYEYVTDKNADIHEMQDCSLPYELNMESHFQDTWCKDENGICGNITTFLAYSNDNGATFEEIANWIEENL